jgi:hypothetical protein
MVFTRRGVCGPIPRQSFELNDGALRSDEAPPISKNRRVAGAVALGLVRLALSALGVAVTVAGKYLDSTGKCEFECVKTRRRGCYKLNDSDGFWQEST